MGFDHPSLRYFIGDVRDQSRLLRALHGVDVVVHAAALKQVPACEYNPLEAVKTNINGATNVIDAALDAGVKKVLALSTDKAVNPVNLYGATKLVAEKLFVQANAYAGQAGTRFACVRYGNVVGSRGSVIPLFKQQRETGRITLTDERMTRFWITLEQGVRFVIRSIELMQGGEVFVPKIPSTRMTGPGRCDRTWLSGRRHRHPARGEAARGAWSHDDEARQALEFDDMYLIQPAHPWWQEPRYPDAHPMPDGMEYSSDTNEWWLTEEDLHRLVDDVDPTLTSPVRRCGLQ